MSISPCSLRPYPAQPLSQQLSGTATLIYIKVICWGGGLFRGESIGPEAWPMLFLFPVHPSKLISRWAHRHSIAFLCLGHHWSTKEIFSIVYRCLSSLQGWSGPSAQCIRVENRKKKIHKKMWQCQLRALSNSGGSWHKNNNLDGGREVRSQEVRIVLLYGAYRS